MTWVGLQNPTTGTVYSILGSYWTNYVYQGQNNPFPYTAFGDNGGASPGNTSGPVSLSNSSTTTTLDVTQSTDLVIPTGVSQIDIGVSVNLTCTAPNSGGVSPICDLSHTGILGFAPLPNGLTYTSNSGVFLTKSPASGVPEASTWAMMALGFAGLGFAGYRRPRAAAVA